MWTLWDESATLDIWKLQVSSNHLKKLNSIPGGEIIFIILLKQIFGFPKRTVPRYLTFERYLMNVSMKFTSE